MFKPWINNIPIVTIPYFQCKICHIDDITVDQAGIHSWTLLLLMVDWYCLLSSIFALLFSYTILLSSFTRKQQLAKYHPAVVLDFWSSLQTTLAQPKDFDRLLLTHLRQRTWYCSLGYLNFSLETWNCFQLGTCFRKTCWPNRLDEM